MASPIPFRQRKRAIRCPVFRTHRKACLRGALSAQTKAVPWVVQEVFADDLASVVGSLLIPAGVVFGIDEVKL